MYGSLELSADEIMVHSPESSSKIKQISVTAVFGLILITIISFNFRWNSKNELGSKMSMSNMPSIAVWNPDYKDSSTNFLDYPFLQDSQLMEPLRPNVVALSDEKISCKGGPLLAKSDCPYSWVLTNLKDPSQVLSGCSQSKSFNVTPLSTGHHSLQVSVQCTGGSYYLLGEYSVWVKYVRREVRSLTDADREEFLQAFRTLWDVSTVEGVEKFGENYKSLFYFATIHNDGGASPHCDEFHGVGGYGFINNHVILGSFLEQSMRLVNPRVSLHYINYFEMFTSDAYTLNHLYNPMDGGAWSEILSDKYFGSNDPTTGRIVDSLWKNSTIPVVNHAFYDREGIDNTKPFFTAEWRDWGGIGANHRKSPVGLLRSPWNFNPSHYTTRFGNVNQQTIGLAFDRNIFVGANCDLLQSYLVEHVVNKPLESMLLHAEDGSHGNIHFAFGGSGGGVCVDADKKLRDDHGFTVDDFVAIAYCSQSFFKVPNKSDYVNSNIGNCSETYFNDETSFNELVSEFFSYAGSKNVPDYFLRESIPLNTRQAAMRLVCNRFQIDSDMEGSGAATDPLFWVSHGNVERLMQKVLLANVLTDKVYPECSGHARDGVKPWLQGFYFEDSVHDAANITNAQLLQILDPSSSEYRDLVNYVYDSGDLSCSGAESWFKK